MRIFILLLISGGALASEEAPNQVNSHAQRCASISLALYRLESQGEVVETASKDEWTARFSWWFNLLKALSASDSIDILESLESSAIVGYDASRAKMRSKELSASDIQRGYWASCEQMRQVVLLVTD